MYMGTRQNVKNLKEIAIGNKSGLTKLDQKLCNKKQHTHIKHITLTSRIVLTQKKLHQAVMVKDLLFIATAIALT